MDSGNDSQADGNMVGAPDTPNQPLTSQEPLAQGSVVPPASQTASAEPAQVTSAPISAPAAPISPKSKLLLPLLLAGALLFGGGAAAYLTVFQKTPEKLWASAMANTSEGMKTYLQNASQQTDKTMKVEGSLKVSSPAAIDGSMSGSFKGPNGTISADIGALGIRMKVDARMIEATGSKNPDIYLKLDGLQGLDLVLGQMGGTASELNEIAQLVDGNWYVIDHTLLDQYLATAEASTTQVSQADVQDAANKAAEVLDKYFFATDENAIFTIREELGREDFEGDPTTKVRVGVEKEKLKTFLTALRDEMKQTNLVKSLAGDDSSVEEMLNLDDVLASIDKQDFTKATADVWISQSGGFIRNVRIYPVEDKKDTNYLDFSLDYAGGDMLPMVMKATIDDDGAKGTLSLGVDLNQSSAQSRWWFDANMDSDGQKITAEGEIKAEYSDDAVNPEKPAGAKSILELLGAVMGGRSLPAGTSDFDASILDNVEL